MPGDVISDQACDGSEAMLRRREWARHVSWYVYGATLLITYVGVFAPSAVRAVTLVHSGTASNPSQRALSLLNDLLFAEVEFLPTLFVAVTFPVITSYLARGFFLLAVVRDDSWIPSAVSMLALLTPLSIGFKLSLARASGLVSAILNNLSFIGMCSLPLLLAVLLSLLARMLSLLARKANSSKRLPS